MVILVCASSVNEIICHGIPDMRPFENGDIVNIDVTVYHKGHHADLNETYFVGDVDPDAVRVVETAYACLAAAVDIGECVCAYVCMRTCVCVRVHAYVCKRV